MVNNGRLDLVQGISTLEDNWAFSSVESIIDDLRPSQEFMEEEFGSRPLVAWQVRSSSSEIQRSLSCELSKTTSIPVVPANPEEKIDSNDSSPSNDTKEAELI